MKPKLLLAVLIPMFLIGCGQNSNTSGGGSGGDNPPEPETFEFDVDFTKATETNSEHDSNFIEKIKSNFVYEDTNLVSNLTKIDFVQVNHVDQVTTTASWTERALMFGSQTGNGQLDFTFTYKLISVRFIARTHTKLYVDQGQAGISSDKNSKLIVNNEQWLLSNRSTSDYGVDDKEFTITSNILQLKTLDEAYKRAWIFSATFVFEK